MSFFATKQTIDIDIGDGNTVTIKAKMDMKTRAEVERDLIEISMKNNTSGKVEELSFKFSKTAQNMALIKHNLVKWRGAGFNGEDGKPVPCRPDTIEQLDPDECPWIEAVAARIDELNAAKVADVDPNLLITDPN